MKSENFIRRATIEEYHKIIQLVYNDILRYNGALASERRIFLPLREIDYNHLQSLYNKTGWVLRSVEFKDRQVLVLPGTNNTNQQIIITLYSFDYKDSSKSIYPKFKLDREIFAEEDIMIDVVLERKRDQNSNDYTRSMFVLFESLLDCFFKREEAEAFALLAAARCSDDISDLVESVNETILWTKSYSSVNQLERERRVNYLKRLLSRTVNIINSNIEMGGRINPVFYRNYLEEY